VAICKQLYVLGEIIYAGCEAFGRDGGAVEEKHAEPPAVDAPRHKPQEVRAGHLWRFGNIATKKNNHLHETTCATNIQYKKRGYAKCGSVELQTHSQMAQHCFVKPPGGKIIKNQHSKKHHKITQSQTHNSYVGKIRKG